MKLLTAALLCALTLPACASSPTATLTDTDGTAWANCSYTATLTILGSTSTPAPTVGGVTVSPLTVTGSCSASGAISPTLTDTSTVDQKNAQWVFTIQSNTSAGPVKVSTPVVGSAPDLTKAFSILPAPRFATGANAYGYNDAEIQGIPLVGATYYNVTTPCLKQYSLAGWTCGGSGGGGAVSSVFGRTGTVVQASGDYSFSQISGTATPSQLGTSSGSASTFLNGVGAFAVPGTPTGSGTPQGIACSAGASYYQTNADGSITTWNCSTTGLNWNNLSTGAVVFAGNSGFVGASCTGNYTFASGVGTDSCNTNNLTTSTAHTDANGLVYSSAADYVALPLAWGAPDTTNLVCYSTTNNSNGVSAVVGSRGSFSYDNIEGPFTRNPSGTAASPDLVIAGPGATNQPIVAGSGTAYTPWSTTPGTPQCTTWVSSSTGNQRMFSGEFEAPSYAVKNPYSANTLTSVYLGATPVNTGFTLTGPGHIYFARSNASVLTTEQIQHNAAVAENLLVTTKSITPISGFQGQNDGQPNIMDFGTSLDVGFGSSTATNKQGAMGYVGINLGSLNYNILYGGAGSAKYCGASNTVNTIQIPLLPSMRAYLGNNANSIAFFGAPTNDLSVTVGSGAAAVACYKTANLTARTAGLKTVVNTITPRTDCTGQCETERQSANTLIRTTWPTFADAMMDLDKDPNMSTNPGSVGCYSDFVHMTDFCYKIWGGYQLSVLNRLTSTSRNSTPYVVASSATPAFDISLGKLQMNTLTASITPTFLNFSPGDQFTLELIENATGGYTVTWPTYPNFINPPTLVTTANAVNVFTFVIDANLNAIKVPTP